MRPQLRLVTRDHIDFGRHVIPIVREEAAKRDAANTPGPSGV
ncbi:hypothetical protein ACFU98_04145 [Streptomyces sp. NPDC057575]